MKQLGLGLIGIGREWGHVPGEVPSEADALRFLESAFQQGIRYFDTAPSYAYSEERIGKFLRTLTPSERASLTVATKFGEEWDFEARQPCVDHTYDGLVRSLERSFERLGKVEVLQLHKTTPEALRSDAVLRAFDTAASMGITQRGPSASDPESAALACVQQQGTWQMMQIPLNGSYTRLLDSVAQASASGIWLAVNRPFAMGREVVEPGDRTPRQARIDAFRYLLDLPFQGVILSGTKSAGHLSENISAFQEAQQ